MVFMQTSWNINGSSSPVDAWKLSGFSVSLCLGFVCGCKLSLNLFLSNYRSRTLCIKLFWSQLSIASQIPEACIRLIAAHDINSKQMTECVNISGWFKEINSRKKLSKGFNFNEMQIYSSSFPLCNFSAESWNYEWWWKRVATGRMDE